MDIVSNRNSGTRCTFSTRKRTLRRGILLHAPTLKPFCPLQGFIILDALQRRPFALQILLILS